MVEDLPAYIAHTVTSWAVIFSVSGGILLWAVIAYLVFRFLRVAPILADLDGGRRTIASVADEEGFAKNYYDLREKLRENPTLSHAWNEFEEVLILDAESDNPVVRNTRGANEYFTQSSVMAGRINLRLYNSLPNLFTGMGILFTFVGLVAGIFLAGKGLAADDTELVRRALQDLLGGAALAFMTSIAGLVASIFFNVAEKRQVHRVAQYIGRWVDSLEHRLNRVTVEMLVNKQLSEIKQQRAAIEQFTAQLAWQIGDEIGKRFNENLNPALEKLVTAVEGMRQDERQDNTDALQQLAQEFRESLSGAAGQELTALGHTLEMLNEKLSGQIDTMSRQHEVMQQEGHQTVEQMRQVLESSTEAFRAEIKAIIEGLSEQLGTAVEGVAKELREAGREAGSHLTELVTQLRTTVTQVNEVLESAMKVAEQHREITESNRGVLEQMGQAGEAIKEVAEPLAASAQAVEGSAQRLQQTSDAIGEASTTLVGTVEQVRDIQKALQEAWSSYERRFGEVDSSLARVLEDLQSGLTQYAETVNGFVQGLDSHTGAIVNSLAGATSELRETLEEALPALEASNSRR